MHDIAVIPFDEFRDRAQSPANPHFSVLIEQPEADFASVRLSVAEWDGERVPRASDTALYVRALAERLRAVDRRGRAPRYPRTVVFQAEDAPVDAPSVSWQRKANWPAVRLVPDLYYFHDRGYEDYMPEVPAWSTRRREVVWRGSSTGINTGIHDANLDQLPRYRLCRAALALGDAADVKLSGIVQAISPPEHEAIARRLADEGLMGGFLPMPEMAQCKLVVDIDGNANSWNFIAKLRLGACVLRVDSPWQQWFSEALTPWQHYVPVAADLSDFADKVEWCLAHDRETEVIARQGREFGLAMQFDDEMLKAARTVFEG